MDIDHPWARRFVSLVFGVPEDDLRHFCGWCFSRPGFRISWTLAVASCGLEWLSGIEILVSQNFCGEIDEDILHEVPPPHWVCVNERGPTPLHAARATIAIAEIKLGLMAPMMPEAKAAHAFIKEAVRRFGLANDNDIALACVKMAGDKPIDMESSPPLGLSALAKEEPQ